MCDRRVGIGGRSVSCPIDDALAEEEAMTPTLTPPPEAAALPAAEERCDRCTAAGKLRIVLAGGGELVFCGHHANKYAPELVKIAVQVVQAPDFVWRGNDLADTTDLMTN
jgi:hypothetical protein